MKLKTLATCVALISCCTTLRAATVYTSGHADIGVGWEVGEGLHIHLHAEDPLGTFGGGTIPAGEHDADRYVIGVPDNFTFTRPAGSQWDFLSQNAGDTIYFLPATEDTSNPKPFLGIATEELDAAEGWTTDVTWAFDSITTVFGDPSAYSIYSVVGDQPNQILASSLDTTNSDEWTQAPGTHNHFNMGFNAEGLYEVTFSVSAVNAGGGTSGIAAGTYNDTATFRFATGGAIAAVPEPSGALLLGLCGVAGLVRRRRK